jgi:hypothetical protein
MKQHWTSRKNQKQKEFSNSNLEVMKGIIRDNESNTVFQDMREKGINVFFLLKLKKNDESKHVCRSCVFHETSFTVFIISLKKNKGEE